MRYLVLSDVHANLEALEAVLAAERSWTQVLVLGDLVGYGADPNAVVERVRALPIAAMVRGNHDKVATGLAPVDSFNPVARHAIGWTTRVLTPENHAWLAALPQGPTPLDERRGDLPRGAARRGLLRLRRAGCAARVGRRDAAAVPLRAHPRRLRVPDRAGRAAGPDARRTSPTCSTTPPRAGRWSTAAPSASRATAIRGPPTASSTPTPHGDAGARRLRHPGGAGEDPRRRPAAVARDPSGFGR